MGIPAIRSSDENIRQVVRQNGLFAKRHQPTQHLSIVDDRRRAKTVAQLVLMVKLGLLAFQEEVRKAHGIQPIVRARAKSIDDARPIVRARATSI